MHIITSVLQVIFKYSYLTDYNNLLEANGIRPLTLDDIAENQLSLIYNRVDHYELINYAIATSNITMMTYMWSNHGKLICNMLSRSNNITLMKSCNQIIYPCDVYDNDVADYIVQLQLDGLIDDKSLFYKLDNIMRYDLIDKLLG